MEWLKKLFAPVDMTVGRPWEDILIFTVPMLIGNIAQQLYNTVDSVVVGKYVGDNALAAVGSAGPILNLLIVLFIGISVGASIMVSQYFGARNREDLSRTIGSCIVLTGLASLFVMVVATMLSRPLLVLLGTPDSILDWCTSYLHILFLGAAGMAYYNILSGVLRGLGDSISALVYLIVASVTNIVLDLVFVAQFKMGVAGVALATVIAQAVSAILCLWKLARMRDLFDMKWSYMRLSKMHTMNIIKLGVPSGVTQAIMSMAMLVVQSLTNSFGEQFIAANVIVMRVDGFAMLPNFSFGTAMTTYAGQNIGARAHDRVTQGAKQGTLMGLGVSAAISGWDPGVRKKSDEHFHEYGSVGGNEYEHDAHPCGRLYCDGSDPVPVRCDARRGRHDDADVDLTGHDDHHPCTAGVRFGVSDKKRTVPAGQKRMYLCFTSDLMADRRGDDGSLL